MPDGCRSGSRFPGTAVPATPWASPMRTPFTSLRTEESLADASLQSSQALEMTRFRPNVVVRGAPRAYDEDDWREITLGATPLRLAKRCERCVMTTIDPATGERGPEPLRAFARYREDGVLVYFGVYLVPDARGRTVRLGDPVSVLERA